ncbi:MAG: YgeY family selenium metabolism-linked hydrolase [Candidatus Aureabacteria bacterium]|nr:YgeY family selenium metabolism-linked hydrolase [Candidatus Auribacterota bacterium]
MRTNGALLGQRIAARAAALREYMAEVLRALIRIKSPSRGEGEAIEFLRREFCAAGCDEVRVDAMGNLIARIGSGSRTLAFDAHVDVVGVIDEPEWRHPPFEGVCEGGFVYGRGVADQKGAIAAMLGAVRIIKEISPAPACSCYFVISVQEEECEGLCWCHLIEREHFRPDAVVITEPSAMKIARGQKGKVQMTVETAGIGSHGSAPNLGENAIYKMAPIIAGIERLNASLRPSPPLSKGSVTVSTVESRAASLCSVPEWCRIHLDRRLTRGETREAAMREIEAVAAPHGGRVAVPRYEGTSHRGLASGRELYFPSWLTPDDASIMKAAQAAHRSIAGRNGEVIIWDFSTNGTATAGIHGIPTIGFGPGEPAMAHRRDERVPVEHLAGAAAFYAALPFCFISAAS